MRVGSTSARVCEIIDEPHHVPYRVVQIRAPLAGAIRFEHGGKILRVAGSERRHDARAMMPRVDRRRREPAIGERPHEREKFFFPAAGSVQKDDGRPPIVRATPT